MMKVQVEEVSPIQRKLHIEVESARVSKELDRAYTDLGRRVKLAGFRPGKIPRRILEQRFREQIEDDVIRRVMEQAYVEAIREHKVDAVSDPSVTNQGFRANQPFEFEVRVEVKPRIEVKDYLGIPLKKTEPKVEEGKVAEQLETLRQRAARLEPIEDREVVQPGDFVQIDYQAAIDGKDFPGSHAENILAEVSPGELTDSHIPELEGAKLKETKEVDYRFPPDHSVEGIRGKVAHFKIEIKALKRKVVPELNDEFAKDLQVGSTVADLRNKVRADLERNEKNRLDFQERQEIIKALSERNSFELPKSMVERTIESMMRGALRTVAQQGVDPRKLNLDLDRFREEIRPRAVKELRGSLLFEAIAEKENLRPTDDEVEQRIAQIAEEEKIALHQVKKQFRAPEERRQLFLRVQEQKTLEFLKSHARYS